MSIKQPDWISATATADGAQWIWTDRAWAEGYEYILSRQINGQWIKQGDGWGNMGKTDRYFAPWVKDGVKATGMMLQIVGNCYGTAWGVPRSVLASEYIAPAPAPVTVVPQAPVASSGKRRVECVNRKSSEIKIFARTTCPKGWYRY
jgi:hypothetical protein